MRCLPIRAFALALHSLIAIASIAVWSVAIATIIISTIAIGSMPALADANPSEEPNDPRIRTVDYNPDDVVTIRGVYRASTLIQFAADEEIEHVGIGDLTAWEVAPAGHLLFLKPREDRARTNMQVVTRKGAAERVYNFELHAREGSIGAKATDFQVNFRYPLDEAKRAEDLAAREKVEDELNVTADAKNRDYWVQGADDLAPIEAFDDGRFTYLKFKPGSAFPAVFTADRAGNEATANSHAAKDWIVIHAIAEKIVLRKGASVACVFNRDPAASRSGAPTGTQSPLVERRTMGRTRGGEVE